jgi:hypothetical protein
MLQATQGSGGQADNGQAHEADEELAQHMDVCRMGSPFLIGQRPRRPRLHRELVATAPCCQLRSLPPASPHPPAGGQPSRQNAGQDARVRPGSPGRGARTPSSDHSCPPQSPRPPRSSSPATWFPARQPLAPWHRSGRSRRSRPGTKPQQCPETCRLALGRLDDQPEQLSRSVDQDL